MVSAPYPLQLHPTFSVPRLSLFLADRRYSCAPPTAVSLARTATCSACRRLRGSLGLDRSRDRQQDAPARARALRRAWVRMNGEVESEHSPRSSRDATLAWLMVTGASVARQGVCGTRASCGRCRPQTTPFFSGSRAKEGSNYAVQGKSSRRSARVRLPPNKQYFRFGYYALGE